MSEEKTERIVTRLRRVMGGPKRYPADIYYEKARGELINSLKGVLWELGATEENFTMFKGT